MAGRGRPRTRVEVGEVPRLHLPGMIADGVVVLGEIVRSDLPGSLGAMVAEMKVDRGQLVVQPRGAPSYLVQVVCVPAPFGNRRWWLVCPETGRRCSTLYLPPGAARFASREAHGLTYRTQRLDKRGRAVERAARVLAKAEGCRA